MTLAGRLLSLGFRAPLILITTVLMGTLSLLASLVDSAGVWQHRCAQAWGRAVLKLAGVRLRVRGPDAIRSGASGVVCANHRSDMDIPVLLAALPFQFRFAAKKSLFRIPFLGWHLRRAGHVPIDRENPRAAMRVLGRTGASGGLPLVVFPEGWISQDGRLAPFRRGAFLLAERTGAGLVPVTILGTREVLPPGSWTLRAGEVEVTVGEAVIPGDRSASELASLVREQVRNQGTAPLED